MVKPAFITLEVLHYIFLTSFGDWNWCCSLIDVEGPISEPCSMSAAETTITYLSMTYRTLP